MDAAEDVTAEDEDVVVADGARPPRADVTPPNPLVTTPPTEVRPFTRPPTSPGSVVDAADAALLLALFASSPPLFYLSKAFRWRKHV